MNSIIKKSIYQYVGNILVLVANFVFVVYIIKELAVETYGEYSFYISFAIFLGLITNFGIPGLIQQNLPKYFDNKIKLNLIVSQFFFIKLILLIIILCLFYFSTIIFEFVPLDYNFLVLMLLIFFLQMNMYLADTVLSVLLKYKLMYSIKLFSAVFKIILLFIVMKIQPIDLSILLCILLFLEVITFFIYLTYLKPFKFKILHPINLNNNKKHIINFYVASLFYFFLTPTIAIWALKTKYGLESVAYYSFTMSISLMIVGAFSLLSKLETLVVSIVINKNHKQNAFESKEYIYLWFKFFIFFTTPIILIFFVFSSEISSMVFENKYSNVMNLLPYLIMGMFFVQINYLYSPKIYIDGNSKLFKKNAIYSALAHLFLLFVLIDFDYKGAIVAMLIALLVKPLNLIYHYGIKNYIPFDFSFYSKLILGLILTLIVKYLFINNLFVIDNFTMLLASLGSVITIYLFIMFVIKPFSTDDRLIIKSKFSGYFPF